MKKSYLLLSMLLLASCTNNQSTSESSKASESSKSSESSVTESSSSVIESSSSVEETSKVDYVDFDFSTIEEIYLDVNETYYLAKMLSSSYSGLKVKYSTDNNYVSVDDKGIITGLDYGDSTVSITYQNKKQDITIHVVDYFEYGSYFTSTDIGRLYGKNAIFFGDSLTHNWGKYTHEMELTHGEDYNYSEYGWSGYIHDKCEFFKITNAACSGGTMSLPKDSAYETGDVLLKSKSLPMCVERNIEDVKTADYAFVFYGTNDYTAQIPITNTGKTVSDDTMKITDSSASFVASMKYGIERMQEVNPDIKIFFMNVMYRTYSPWKVSESKLTYSRDAYNKAIKDVATAYMCKVIDTSSLFDASNWSKYTNDGILHLNDDGQKLVANFVLNNGVK